MSKDLKRVLVVDDEEDLTWSISKNLAKDKNIYDLICVNSGKDALNVLNQVPVDLVVTDIRMPEVSGLDLLLSIKGEFPTTRVIIMTAYGSEDIQKEVYRRGSIAYIEKPFETNALRDLILTNLEEKKGFVGQVSDFQLSDIIQMNCLGRLTTALKIVKGSENGSIFFQEGNIIHAEVSGKEGEEAFFEILSWQGGEFSSRKGTQAKKETIFKGWQSLLLEGMKRADEEVPERKVNLEEEKKIRIEKIEKLIKTISEKKKINTVAVLDKQGFSLASYLNLDENSKLELADVLNIGSQLIELYDSFNEEFSFAGFKFSSMEFDQFNCHFLHVSDTDYYLIIISQKQVNEGALRLILKKVLPELKELL